MSPAELYREELHPLSRCVAVFEDDGTSAWLYLSHPDQSGMAGDAWVYNRIPAPTPEAIRSYRGGPPPAAAGFAADTAQCANPLEYQWSFRWSADGTSLALLRDGQPVAFIVAGDKQGYSRNLLRDGPWGLVFSDERFGQTFGAG
ncbi:MAG: hypothetical protein AB7F89_14470 [Pirellulaceae bacterium]